MTNMFTGLRFWSTITKSKRGWSVATVNEKGGGCNYGAGTLSIAIYECLDADKLGKDCLPEYIEIKGVKFTPAEAVKKFMKRGFWYDHIYPQFQVLSD